MGRADRALIGRTDALSRIAAGDRRAPGPNVVLITGEAGIGKSRLLDHVVDEHRAGGRRVLYGRCVEVSGEPIPYAPINGALRTLRRDTDDEALAADIDLTLGLRPGGPRDLAEFFELVLSIVDRLVRQAPVVLALEDLHWADQGTLDLISFLVRNLDGDVLLVLTYRDVALRSRPRLAQLVETLVRARVGTLVELERLTRDELAALSAQVTGSALTGAALDRLQERSQGNPFIAEELLVADPTDSTSAVPATLHDILLARAAEIDEHAERLVRVTALIGRPVSHDLLARASGQDEDTFAAAVQQTVGSGLMVVDQAREEYEFRHVLTRDAIGGLLLPSERRRVHAAIATALRDDPDVATNATRAAEWAAHVLASGDRPAAAVALVESARLSARRYAYAAAWHQYCRAVELLDALPDGTLGMSPATVLAEAADAARWSGDIAAAISLAERAERDESDYRSRALIAERIGAYHVEVGRFADAEVALERATALAADVDDPTLRARIAVSSARIPVLTARHKQAIPLARDALALADRAGAGREQGRAHAALGMCQVLIGDVREGLDELRTGNDLVHRHGDLDDRRRADSNLAFGLLVAGRTAEACEVGLSGLAMMRRYGVVTTTGGALTSNTIMILRVSGRWDEADELAAEVADGLPPGMAERVFLARSELDLARGDLARAARHLGEARRLAGEDPPVDVAADLRLVRAALAVENGACDAAGADVDAVLATVDDEMPRAVVRACVLGLRVEAARTRWGRRSASGPDARLERLRSRARESTAGRTAPEFHAYALTAAAEFSRAVHDSDSAAWEAAAQCWDSLGRVRGAAYCLLRQGEAELFHRRTAGAREPLERAYRSAVAFGCTPIVDEVRSVAERGRIRLDAAVTAEDDRGDRPLLTPREIQVLAQVAAGRSNRGIADQLYLSHRTVGVHVSNVLAKLHVHTRAEAVAKAGQWGLLDRTEVPRPT